MGRGLCKLLCITKVSWDYSGLAERVFCTLDTPSRNIRFFSGTNPFNIISLSSKRVTCVLFLELLPEDDI